MPRFVTGKQPNPEHPDDGAGLLHAQTTGSELARKLARAWKVRTLGGIGDVRAQCARKVGQRHAACGIAGDAIAQESRDRVLMACRDNALDAMIVCRPRQSEILPSSVEVTS